MRTRASEAIRLTSHSNSALFGVARPKVYDRLSEDDVLGALRRMHRIRRFEEAAEDSYIRGLSYGTMHLSIGQEATAVGACMPLSEADCITSTHRGHGHCIAKGAELKPMFAEFLGREGGYCKGRGGSMHIAEPARGNLGANGIVGGGLPIAVGAALSAKKRRTGAVALAFFGDGANNEGAFHEALNIASIWKLPVVFVCENNQYAMSMSMARGTAVANVVDRASAYAIPGVIVDGNDFAAVAEASFEATERARAGDGPTLIEAKTYRTRGHSRSDRNRYRSRQEIEAWKARDPVARFEKEIIALGLATEARVEAIATEVEKEMAGAAAEASASPWPAVADVARDVYSPPEGALL
jgi:TPP-dependent pyruvate/acetoin dehydrogenase alpha subunit